MFNHNNKFLTKSIDEHFNFNFKFALIIYLADHARRCSWSIK